MRGAAKNAAETYRCPPPPVPTQNVCVRSPRASYRRCLLMLENRTRQPRRLVRWTLSALGLVLFAAVFLAIFVWNVPQSPRALGEAVRLRLETATGTAVRFNGAEPRLIVRDRLLEIRDVAFYDSGSDAPAFSIASIDVTLPADVLLPGRDVAAERIVIGGPTPLEYEYARDGLRPGRAARFLTDTLKRMKTSGGSSSPDLRIDDVEVEVVERSSGLPETLAVLHGVVTVSASPDTAPAAEFQGLIEAGGLNSTLAGTLSAHSPTSRTLAFQLGKFRLPFPTSAGPVVVSADAGAAVRLGLGSEGTLRFVAGSAEIPELNVDAPQGGGLRFADKSIVLSIDADYDTSAGALLFREGAVASESLEAQVRGTASWSAPNRFDLQTSSTRVGGIYQQLFARLLPPGWELQAPEDNLRFGLALAGDRNALSDLTGALSFSSATLSTPALPKPLRELGGELRFGAERIEVRSVSGVTGRTRVGFDGELTGDYLRGDDLLLSLDWQADARASDLAAILAASGSSPADPQAARGSISGKGTLRHRLSLRGPAGNSLPPEIDGSIRLADVTLNHALLPAPITALDGALSVQGAKLQIESLSGQFGGTPVEVKGDVTGDQVFWREPAVAATLTARLVLANLPPSLPEEIRRAASESNLHGNADARIRVEGPLERLAEARITGTVALTKADADLQIQGAAVEIRGGDASLSWNGAALILDKLSARMNGEPFTGSGLLSRDHLSLDAKGTIELAAVTRTFPQSARWFDMSGPAAIDLRMRQGKGTAPVSSAAADDPDASAVKPNFYTDRAAQGGSAAELNALLQSAGTRLTAALAVGGAEGVEGSIVLGNKKEGARVHHLAMPGGARKYDNGRPIPRAELRNLRGRLTMKSGRISTSEGAPLTCDLTDTKNCSITATAELRPGMFPKMKITASSRSEAVFDTWMTGWGNQMDIPPTPPDTGHAFDLDLTFTAPRAIYKGQRAGRTRLELTYNLLHRPNSPRKTVFKRIEIDGAGGGRMTATGELHSFVWRASEFPRWNAQARFDRMPMLPLLTWIFQDVRNIDGFASGELVVEGIKTDALSIRGNGSTIMTNLIIDRTPLIQGLARQTGRQLQGRRFSSVGTTNFTISEGAMASRNLQLDSSGGLLLEMKGRYFFADSPRHRVRASTIIAVMRLKIFESVLQQLPIVSGIPLVGQLAQGASQLADQVAGAFLLAFEVNGPASQPVITPVALPIFQGAD